MKVQVQKSFEKDVLNLTDRKIAQHLKTIICELESCKSITSIRHLKKMKGGGNYYRIRIGNYRLGIKLEADTISLLRFMQRKEIYKYFP